MGKKKNGAEAILPFGDRWEHWSFESDGRGRFLGASGNPNDFKSGTHAVMAVPSRYLTNVPVALATEDPALVDDMTMLQMENQGLASSGDGKSPIFSYRMVRQRGGTSLLLNSVLSSHFPENLSQTRFERYDAVPSFLKFPPNRWTLWQEPEGLVAALTSGEDLVFFTALTSNQIGADFCLELKCLNLQLSNDGLSPEKPALTSWIPLTNDDVAYLQQELGWNVSVSERPTMSLAKTGFDLTPRSVRDSHEAAARRKKFRRMTAFGAMLYALGLMGAAGYLGWIYQDITRMNTRISANAGTVQEIQTASAGWSELTLVVDPKSYALEILDRLTKLLPDEGVRVVEFDLRGYEFNLIGEARNHHAAIAFSEAVKKNPEFAGYRWEIPQPKRKKNNATEFRITGIHPNGPVKEE